MAYWTKLVLKVALICLLSCNGLAQGVDLLAEVNATVDVQENIALGSYIYTVDILVEGEIALEENEAFEIDGSGQVFTVALLDCETQSSYELVVSVFSPELNVSEDGVLNVNVRDVNDNRPVFVQSFYAVAYIARRETVSEPDRVVVQVRATDADCTFANRQVTYSIPGDAFGFSINATSGELFAPVNVTSGLFIFDVFATDSGGLNGTALAFITFTADCGPVPTITNGFVINVSNTSLLGDSANVTCAAGYYTNTPEIECTTDATWEEAVCLYDCGEVMSPVNGETILIYNETTFGSIATFTCDPGYTLSANVSLECDADGQWNGTEPTCVINECSVLADPLNGTVYLGSVTFGSTAVFECDAGFDLIGSANLTCLSNGTWDLDPPECIIKDCGTPRTLPNGNFTTDTGDTIFGTTTTYWCDDGFDLEGSETSLCLFNGTWEQSLPFCRIRDCGQLDESRVRRQVQNNGQLIIISDNTTYGSIATFECNPGYTLSSNITLYCTAEGSWNGSVPTCDINDCGEVMSPVNGETILTNNLTTFGSIATFNCDPGYTLSSNISLECNADGQWNGTEPTCIIKDCGALESLENGVVSLENNSTTFGSSATFECIEGYRLSREIILNCTAAGIWDDEAPTCAIKDCNDLPAIASGSITYQNDATTVGSLAQFQCNVGYTLSNTDILWCQEDGTWNGSVPSCQIKDCGGLGDLDQGSIILGSGTTTYGSNATFQCDAGYSVSENTVLVCAADGQWNGTKPSCQIKDCGNISTPVNGLVSFNNNSTTVGSTANFSCNVGYDISNTDILYCTIEGIWNGTAPTCQIKDCGSVTLGDHVSVAYTNSVTTFGSLATFSCSTGYSTTGNTVAMCTSDGTWNHTSPNCTLNDCGPLESPKRGSVSTSGGTLVNATATYSCNDDFRLIGDTTRTCQPSGRWSGSDPSCVRAVIPVTPCPVTTDSRGTQWSQSLPSQIREAECPQGFTGNVTRQCNSEGNWNPPIYNCLREKVRNIKQKAASLNNASTAAEVNQVLVELLNVTDETTGDSVQATDQLTDGELTSLSVSFEDVADVISEDQVEDVADTLMTTASNLIDDTNRDTWINVGESEGVGAERVISAVDTVTEKITGKIQATGGGSVVISKKNIAVEVRRIDDEDISFPYTLQNDDIWQNSSTSASIQKAAFQGGNVTSTGVIFRNMSAITRGNKNSGGSGAEINGPVVAMTVKPAPEVLDPPLRVIFQHTLTGLKNPSCNFWNITESRWSTSGCVLVSSNDTVSVCECDHLTNFAVLMSAFVEADSESTALRIASIVGIGISMACLILTLAVHFCLWRYLRNDRTTILMHLCVALLASYIVFLAGVDRTESRVFCAIVAVLLQYIYLVVFCVMLAEGIEIGITVLFVFVKRSRIKPLLIGAWVIPAIIVAISLGVTKAEGYGNENFCWLSIESGLIWAFIGPALAIILFNFVILLIVIKVMFSTKAMEQKKKLKKVKTGLRSLGVLIPLMGVTWIIGIFYINEDFYWIQYVFSILNGLQGFFIFLFHCVLNPQIKNARTAQQRRKSSTSLKSTMRTTYKSGSKSDNENSGNEHSNAYLAKSISEETPNMMDNPYKLGRGSGGVFDKRSPKITLPNGSNLGFDRSSSDKDA